MVSNNSTASPGAAAAAENLPSASDGNGAGGHQGGEAHRLRIVGIGASAGGLEAFTELVGCLPSNPKVAYVLVQHLDPTHRSLLSELLGRSASLPVQEIEQSTRVQARHIYVIPPNCDLAIREGVLELTPREKNSGSPARSIDHFLKSLAVDRGASAIGVILSGAGSDGAEGLRAIKDAGGLTFAQDENSSKYDSMPRSAIATGCVDFVLPPEKIAGEIARILATPRHTARRAAANARNRRGRISRKTPLIDGEKGPEIAWPKAPEDANLRRIFLLLRTQTGIDFNLYRINTIRRRLTRRLGLVKAKDLEAYYQLLREDREELNALHQDLLINVTNFFRNPGVFETLKKKIFPRLVKQLGAGETLRFWIAGCSTGQEAYSYAIAFTEFIEKQSPRVPLQIFASDVNAQVLEEARGARYTRAQLTGLNAARITRFFTRENDAYRVQKPLRDMVIFAQQNLLTDPPFTRVDLISCRNMLIYIEPALQQKILPTFHYAMKPNGHLVLGTSESIGSFTNLFSSAEKPHKIYVKKPAVNRRPERIPPPPTLKPIALAPRTEPVFTASDAFREADRLILARYAPPAVLVNDDGEILQFRGKVQAFLELPTGKASFNLFKLARGHLGLALQKALKRARTENRPIREKLLPFESVRAGVELVVIPFKRVDLRCFLVVFEKRGAPEAPARPIAPAAGRVTRAEAGRLSGMKRELTETRHHLDYLREQHETVVEELQASNEEVQSSNEELQSLNEELETSNEELESANEELTTLNEELATRNTELRESEGQLRDQAQLVEMAPLLVRSTKDRIIFWNRGAEKLYGFSREEAIGQTSHLLLQAKYSEPLKDIQAALEKSGHWEGEVVHQRKDGAELQIATQWVLHTDDKQRPRAVLEVNTDISARKQAERSLRESQEMNRRILQATPDCILVLDLAGRVLFRNDADHAAALQDTFRPVPGQHWSSLWHTESRAGAETAYRAALGGDSAQFHGISLSSRPEPQWWDVVVRPILDDAGHPERLLAVCRDITERKLAELAAHEEAKLAALRADVAIEVARGGELGPILQQLTQMIVHHTDAVYARIWLLDEEDSVLKLSASAGFYAHLNNQQVRLMVGEGRIGAIASTKRSYVTHQITADSDVCDPEWARREGLTTFAGFPLIYESKVLGVLAILSRRRLEPRPLRELSLSADAIALLVQRKHADDERVQLLQQTMESRNAALAASRAKDDFLATLSHELRTPLNPVMLLASDGAENADFPPAVRSVFETIRNNVSLEARLIDDLLDLTRIAHGKLALHLQPMDLNATVIDAIRIVSANVAPNTIRLVQEVEKTPAVISGDAMRLQQVFWNILNNAMKFTPSGGTVTVRTRTEKRQVCVEISDTGIGLQSEDLKRIFDPFSQIECRKGGLGLGLAISRQLLELHRGSIRAESDGPGRGSTFVVELPLAPSGTMPAKARAAQPAPGADSAPPHRPPLSLLLVEDHASTRTTLNMLLSRRGFLTTTAASVAEARACIAEKRFDILISDLGLPDGHGHDLLAEFRQAQPHLIGVALSGYGSEEDRARSHAAGYSNHLVKPVSIADLNVVIEHVLATAASKEK